MGAKRRFSVLDLNKPQDLCGLEMFGQNASQERFNCKSNAILIFLTFQLLVIAHLTAGMVDLTRHEKEKYFLTTTGEKRLFPSLHDPHSRELSVVVPAYNEELRCE